MPKADDYNRRELEAGRITYEHLDALAHTNNWLDAQYSFAGFADLVSEFQEERGLVADGMLGPATRAALVDGTPRPVLAEDPKADEIRAIRVSILSMPLEIDSAGWLIGPKVKRVPAHSDWYGGPIDPDYVIHHVTATQSGAEGMARRRTVKFDIAKHGRGKSSWHATVDRGGFIWQMVPFIRRAYHAGGNARRDLPDGRHPNSASIGIEMIGLEHQEQTPAQVLAMAKLLYTVTLKYDIPRANHLGHRQVNKVKGCPGNPWFLDTMPTVLDAVYQGAA